MSRRKWDPSASVENRVTVSATLCGAPDDASVKRFGATVVGELDVWANFAEMLADDAAADASDAALVALPDAAVAELPA